MYVGPHEAIWRIFEYPMHLQSHNVVRLSVHLENEQKVYFIKGQEKIASVKDSMLMAYFKLCASDSHAKQLFYSEIPKNYTWDLKIQCWKARKRGGEKAIGRIYTVSLKNMELYCLCLLLLHVRGPESFDD